uniref:MARVEL domain-containing protein n=1 Tax=Anopheles culicifacies TaxID=139723 RepID=A0A182MVR5_9DIPT
MPSTVIRMPTSGGGGGGRGGGHLNEQRNRGVRIGCCRVCTCVNLDFFVSKNGILKCFELVLGWFCQTMLIQFGMDSAKDIGEAYWGFLTTCSAFLLTTTILLICYTISARTFHLVRQSIFEVVYNGLACAMYFSAASYLGFAVNVFLYPKFLLFKTTGGIHSAYPAMTAVYRNVALEQDGAHDIFQPASRPIHISVDQQTAPDADRAARSFSAQGESGECKNTLRTVGCNISINQTCEGLPYNQRNALPANKNRTDGGIKKRPPVTSTKRTVRAMELNELDRPEMTESDQSIVQVAAYTAKLIGRENEGKWRVMTIPLAVTPSHQ